MDEWKEEKRREEEETGKLSTTYLSCRSASDAVHLNRENLGDARRRNLNHHPLTNVLPASEIDGTTYLCSTARHRRLIPLSLTASVGDEDPCVPWGRPSRECMTMARAVPSHGDSAWGTTALYSVRL
jgi:hypothetical protein